MYKVEWAPETDEQLAAIWTDADSDQRRAIVEATNTIDRELKVVVVARSGRGLGVLRRQESVRVASVGGV
jgi:hypothetical protein